MTKTSTRGGLLTRALSCGCAAALAASLAPAAGIAWAAALPAVDGSATLTVNIGTIDSSNAFTAFTSASVATGTKGMQAKYQEKAVLFKDSSGWNVAATNRFLALDDILEAADLDEYWTPDAKLAYSASSAASSAAEFATYASYQDRYFFPDTKVDTNTSEVSSPAKTAIETGVALNAYTALIGSNVNTAASSSSSASTAGGTADLMYDGFAADVEPAAALATVPTVMNGLTVSDYQAGWNGSSDAVVGAAAVASINIAVPEAMNASRIYGTEWADTMVDAVDAAFSSAVATTTNIVLTTADTFQDALAASGLAGALECPIMMTESSQLTDQTADLLQKYLKAQIGGAEVTVYVIGGEVAIEPTVIDSIKQLPEFYGKQSDGAKGLNIVRIAGDEAWDTSLEIRKAILGDTKYGVNATMDDGANDVVIACSGGFEDAMSIAPYAYATGTPVVLTNSANALSDDELYALNGVGVTNALDNSSYVNIVGGPSVVSTQVETQLAGIEKIYRTYGQSAYDTSNRIASNLAGGNDRFRAAAVPFANATVACFATGENYKDALASSPYCGSKGYPLALVSNDDSTTIDNFLSSNAKVNGGKIVTATIFGGEGVLGKAVQMDINQALIKADN